jgi:hypothetical protein
MLLGLGTRTALRQFLLGALASRTTTLVPDATVDALGLGVAALFDRHCNRQIVRVVGDTVTFEGARATYVLPRYPVEELTTIEVQSGFGADWAAQTAASLLGRFDEASGLIEFKSLPTTAYGRVRVTWTGGYWVADDGEDASDLPAGATALPADLQLLWLNTCQEFWNKRDKLGLALAAAPDQQVAIAKLELPAGVRQMLAPWRRFQLT